ncbi:MAG TPA: UvrD-helicase domain-containing protein [Spirochaetia bacterium]|nr:UvrD-helicase domain-containing protein [Spirochaetia bacterium]
MEELDLLNSEQKAAVLHSGPPLLILAGAGSGKTRVITTKIAYLISERATEPRSILAVTFTNKAAEEMRSRVLRMVPESAGLMIRTFHSFGAWLLRRSSHLLGLNAHFSIYDEEDSLALLKQVLDKKTPREDLKRYTHLIGRAKDRFLSPSDDLRSLTSDPGFDDTYHLYQKKLEGTGNADFGDLIMRSVELLRENPEVRERIQQRFRVILVDEYQDANTAQFLLLKELYSEESYLCVVGDEDQSIYGFRGAEVRNILEFPKVFPRTQIIRLEENYRSTERILEAAIRVVENNRQRLGKNLWTRKPQGSPLGLAYLNNEEEEARFCAQVLSDGNYEQTALLYRNNYQSRPFETLFSRLHIPYRLVGTLRFAEREEVKDALAYLSLILNPRDEIAFIRIVNKPSRGIGSSGLQKILSTGRSNLLEACREALPLLPRKTASNLEEFLRMVAGFETELSFKPLPELIRNLLLRSGLYEMYKQKDDREGANRMLNLEELVNASMEYGNDRSGLAEFLESLTLNSSDENPFNQDGRVNLITFHNTKGLEFDRVIITGLEDGLFPHYRNNRLEEDLELEEERRLFYVALTRARKSLYLTSCRMRRVFGVVQTRSPSRFLAEIPSALVEVFSSASFGPEDEYTSRFQEGSGVRHGEYGDGTIEKKWYNGREYMVLIRFFSGRTARFILKYSNLVRINHDEF